MRLSFPVSGAETTVKNALNRTPGQAFVTYVLVFSMRRATSSSGPTGGRPGQVPTVRLSLKNASRSGSRPRRRPISSRIACISNGS